MCFCVKVWDVGEGNSIVHSWVAGRWTVCKFLSCKKWVYSQTSCIQPRTRRQSSRGRYVNPCIPPVVLRRRQFERESMGINRNICGEEEDCLSGIVIFANWRWGIENRGSIVHQVQQIEDLSLAASNPEQQQHSGINYNLVAFLKRFSAAATVQWALVCMCIYKRTICSYRYISIALSLPAIALDLTIGQLAATTTTNTGRGWQWPYLISQRCNVYLVGNFMGISHNISQACEVVSWEPSQLIVCMSTYEYTTIM